MSDKAAVERVRTCGLALLIVAGWMLQHPYAGIFHDTVLYTLLALSRLYPQSLSHDVFVRFGSQDAYTVFSPVFAAAIRWLALGPAAALLTFVFQAALFACAYLFARRNMPASLALLGIGLLVVLPTEYGAGEVFHCTEEFLTPRLPAEALVLAGLAATLASRFTVGGLCLLAAMLFHPIMGSAGVALVLCMFVAIPRPKLTVSVVVGCVVASLVLLLVIHGGPFERFDAQWFRDVSASKYLFPTLWTLRDWSRASVPLAVLASGFITGEDPKLRRLCAACLIVGAAGILLTVIYADWLHVILVTAMQLWRWLWITNVVAIVCAPLIFRDCWNRSPTARAVPLILTSAYALSGQPAALALSLLAVVCALASDRVREPRMSRVIVLSSCALLCAVVINCALQVLSYVPPQGTGASAIAHSVRWLRDNAHDGLLYAAVLTAAWRISPRLVSLGGAAAFALLAMVPCVALASTAWKSWTDFYYTASLRARFAPWRSQIPADAEVIWPETPMGAWYLLDRPSYWSFSQLAGDVFSRPKSIELQRRWVHIDAVLKELSPTRGTELDPKHFTRVDARGFRLLCADPTLRYFVTYGNFGPTPFEPIAPNPARSSMRLRLYRCADFLKGVSSDTSASGIRGDRAGD
jgi:hypothetical protein